MFCRKPGRRGDRSVGQSSQSAHTQSAVPEPGAQGYIGNRTISVARIDNRRLDEAMAHGGQCEAVISVAVVADGSSMERVSRDRCDATIAKMPAKNASEKRAVRTR